MIGGRSLLIIADEIARLERSIQLFLDFARPPALQTVESSIAEIIQSTIELMQSKAIKSAWLFISLAPRLR